MAVAARAVARQQAADTRESKALISTLGETASKAEAEVWRVVRMEQVERDNQMHGRHQHGASPGTQTPSASLGVVYELVC